MYNILYGIFLLIVVVINSPDEPKQKKIAYPGNCGVAALKTPFCGKVFEPTCNCAVLNIQNPQLDQITKPLYDMKALKRMQMNHGPLNELPKSFARAFENLVSLDLSYNALTSLPKELGQMKLAFLEIGKQ